MGYHRRKFDHVTWQGRGGMISTRTRAVGCVLSPQTYQGAARWRVEDSRLNQRHCRCARCVLGILVARTKFLMAACLVWNVAGHRQWMSGQPPGRRRSDSPVGCSSGPVCVLVVHRDVEVVRRELWTFWPPEVVSVWQNVAVQATSCASGAPNPGLCMSS